MDFFNHDPATAAQPTIKTQRYGAKAARERALEPELPDLTQLSHNPLPSQAIRKDLFINEWVSNIEHEQPTQQDLSSLSEYFKSRPAYEKLPICKHKPEIIRTVNENSVTIITAPTGSGKSTRVPQYLMDNEYYNEQRHFKIVVTQPRRVAAMSLTQRVLSERGLPKIDYTTDTDTCGTLVGYQIGMDRQVNEDTRLIYMTTGVLLRKLISAGNLNEFTHIILDEVHERDKDTDFLLLLVKKFLCTNSKFVKVVVMSATVNADKFSRYYMSLICGIPTPAPKIEITERMFNVVVFYLDDFKHSVGDHSEYSETDRDDDPQISDRIYAIAAALIDSFVDIERDEQDLGPKQDVEDKGAVLVFLPGIFEIEMMQRVLMRKSNQAESFVIIALHSSIPRSSQMCVFDQPQMGKRKVILSTNIAESSITVPDIRYVIDFCLTKQLYMDPGTGLSSLQYRWAPKSSLDQRKGRAGRVTGGRCYRLINKGFVTSLSDWTTPEMRRCSLEQLILWCKILNVGEPQTILSLALDPPDLDRLYESTLLLQQVGALVLPTSPDEPFSGGLTFLGQVMGSMPLDVRLTRLVMFGFVFSCFTECIIMAACLSLPAFLEVPYSNKKDKLKSYINRMKTAKGTFSDPIMMLHVFNSWLDVHTTRPNQSKRYCSDNFIQFNRIQEVASLIQDLEGCIRRFNIPHEAIGERKISDMDSEYIRRLKLALAGANYPNYFIKDKYAINKETCLRMFGDKSPSDTVMFTGLNLDIRSDYDLEKKFYRDIRAFYREGFDSIKKLSLESSRLYISFENPREAMVCKSVYYALKMKKLGMTLTLNSKITEEEEAVPSCVNIPIKSGCLEVFVTYVVSPSKLYVQLVGSETQSEWRRMEEDLQYAPLERWPSFIPEKSYGIAQFAEDACSRWCRVSVETVHQDQLRVVYLDWGNKAWIKGRELYKIPPEYLRVPFQATECSLENISPVSSQHNADNPGTWDKAAADFLNTCILNKTFTANIYYVLNDVLYLDLIAGSPGVSLKSLLITRGFALEALPDFRTQQAQDSAAYRKDLTLGVGKLDAERQVKTDRLNFLSEQAKLSGPTSPYEVSFRGLTAGSMSRSTVMDQNSVNCIHICPNPRQDYNELLTAGSIALSSDGQKITLRGTTSHQPIPGFPELAVLVFAPKVQLQCSPGKLHYTGCVAGLGTDSSGSPLWPDHDLHIPFDVRLHNTDFREINKLRMNISRLMRADDENPTVIKWSRGPIREMQRSIVRLVNELLLEPRPRIAACNELDISWRLPSGTEPCLPEQHGSLAYPGEDTDLLIPHKVLRVADGGPFLECEDMASRVQDLISATYRTDDVTGIKDGEGLECELCGKAYPSFFALRSHLSSPDHKAEKDRLDHWAPPGKVRARSGQ